MVTNKKLILSSFVGLLLLGETTANETENPFTFEASYVGDGVANMHGGIETGATYLGMGNIKLNFSTENAKLWKGGNFFINGANIHGTSPTEKLIGDFQVIDNIDGGNHTYMHELWYKQSFSRFHFTVGLQDLNAEFAVIENGGDYINSSFGISSLIATNTPVPIFPLTALGVSWHWDIIEKFAWKGAIFDGCPTDFEDNKYNLNWDLNKDEGMLAFTEFQLSDIFKFGNGSYKLGGYYHSKMKERDEETNEKITVFDNNYGFFIIVDQDIKEWDNGKKLAAFAQVAFSPKDKNTHNYYYSAGVNFYAPFKRENDVVGLAFSSAGFHEGMHKHETVIEAFYRIQFTENISLQPDIQYIINPSGTDEKLDNALAGIVRLRLEF